MPNSITPIVDSLFNGRSSKESPDRFFWMVKMSLKSLPLDAFSCAVAFLFVAPCSFAHADLLGSVESYSEWTDVTNQPAVGNWTKNDSPNPVVTEGEMVSAPAHGSVVPKDGAMLLDFRTEARYVSGGDGADYSYHIDPLDYGGLNPSTHDNGTVELSFWICPDTWSNDIGFFLPEGIYQTTSLVNGSGEVVASVGLHSVGNTNAPVVHYSVDGTNWTSTGLSATNTDWTQVSFAVDLASQTSEIAFEDFNGSLVSSGDLNWSAGITDSTVQSINFQMVDQAGKNYFDDFDFSAVAIAVPEPSILAPGLFGLGLAGVRRRRLR